MNLVLSTTFLKDGTPLHEALDECLKAGVEAVELGSNHCFQDSYSYISQYPFQYLVHNYFPIPIESFVLNIASFDDGIREKSISHIKKAIDFCSGHSAKLYTFHPGFLTDPNGANKSDNNYDFQWDERKPQNSHYKTALNNMYHALDEVVKYAQLNYVNIAIETEGSLNNKDHLLMQQPEEYEVLMKRYSSGDLGINLNIGHLNLAANAFDFNRYDFVNLIQNYILAMELSHNDGQEDQHLPLEKENWYWDIILDQRFKNSYKILEFRNTSTNHIQQNVNLFQEKSSALSVSG